MRTVSISSSYISGILSFGMMFWVIAKVGVYHKHYVTRSIEYARAEIFLSSSTCVDPVLKSGLGDFNLCDNSTRVLYTQPWVQSIYDTAEDLRYCGHDACSKHLPKIIIVVLIVATAVLMISGSKITDDRRKATYEYFSLPMKAPDIHVHED